MSILARRRLLWIGGCAGAALVALYLLRWPLVGGLVLRQLERAAGEAGARLERADLSGSLVFGVRARDVVLRPANGAPFREASAREIAASYGLFGLGSLNVRIHGARVVLAEGTGPSRPVHEEAREIVAAVSRLRWEGRLAAQDATIVLADGRAITIEDALVGRGSYRASLRAPGFGAVHAAAVVGPDGTLDAEARASEGPVSELRVEVGPLGGDRRRSLRAQARNGDQTFAWQGFASFDLESRPDRVEGELSVGAGRASTSVDLVSGTFQADGQTKFAIRGDLVADVSVAGRVEGSLTREPSTWTVSSGVVRTWGATYRGLRIDEAEATAPSGTLSDLPWKARARREEDRVEAEGVLRWNGTLELTAAVRARAAQGTPYLALLGVAPPVVVENLALEGQVTYGASGLAAEGALTTGKGEVPGFAWESSRLAARGGPDGVHVKELVVRDTPLGPSVTATASLGPKTPEGRTVLGRVAAGEDAVAVSGRLTPQGGFEGDVSLSGPLASLRAFGIVPPEALRPVRVGARLSGAPDAAGARLELALGTAFRASATVTVRREGPDWRVDVAPGSVFVAGRRLDVDDFRVEVKPGSVSVSGVGIRTENPALSGQLGAAVAWNEREVVGSLDAAGLAIGDLGLEGFQAKLRVDRRTGDVESDLSWGSEGVDHLIATGRIGSVNDFRLSARLDDLKNPAVAQFIPPEAELAGSVAIELRLTGSRERPEVAGTLTLGDVSAYKLPPIRLTVPIRTEAGVLKISASEATPFGSLTLDGRLPFAEVRPEAPIDLTARLDPVDPAPLLARIPESVRAHLPQGRLSVQATVGGTLGSPAVRAEARFTAERYAAPKPLGPVTNVLLTARWEGRRITLDALEAQVGKGHLRVTGTWDFGARGNPLTARLEGKELLVVDEQLIRVRVDPELVLTKSEAGWRLDGSVQVPVVLVYAELASGKLGTGARKVKEVRPPGISLPQAPGGGFLILPGIPGLDAVKLDVQATTSGECRIENNVVGGLVKAEARVRGTLAAPALSGVARARSGEVKLTTGVFIRIEKAEAVLPAEPGQVPRVRFEGRTGYGKGAIQLAVDGPLSGPDLRLTSDPPRSQEELLAYLAFGQFPGSVSGTGALGVFALRFYKETTDARPRAEPRESFFDRLNPEIHTPETKSDERRVPWALPAGTSRGTVVRTEYFISDYFSVIAETDREANVGGDLKLRLRF